MRGLSDVYVIKGRVFLEEEVMGMKIIMFGYVWNFGKLKRG